MIAELETVLLEIYGDREKVKRWIASRGLCDPKAEARALGAWHRPTLEEDE